MKKITFCFLSLFTIITFAGIALAGCKKYNESNYLNYKAEDLADTIQLLTAAPWKLLSYGYDNNADGTIDKSEESIDDCQKTNLYLFNTNGTGTVTEDKTICGNDADTSVFSWTLTDNKTILDFIYGISSVAKIDHNKMVLTDTHLDLGKLITIYGH